MCVDISGSVSINVVSAETRGSKSPRAAGSYWTPLELELRMLWAIWNEDWGPNLCPQLQSSGPLFLLLTECRTGLDKTEYSLWPGDRGCEGAHTVWQALASKGTLTQLPSAQCPSCTHFSIPSVQPDSVTSLGFKFGELAKEDTVTKHQDQCLEPGVVAYTCNPSTCPMKTGRQQVQDQPRLHT